MYSEGVSDAYTDPRAARVYCQIVPFRFRPHILPEKFTCGSLLITSPFTYTLWR